MAYDRELAERVRAELAGEDGVSEKAMFGGLAFLLAGKLAVAVSHRGGLMVRVGAEGEEQALSKAHTEPFQMRGRAMPGWVYIGPPGLRTRRQLAPWVHRAASFVRSLPAKR